MRNANADRLNVAVEDLSTNERIAWQHRLSGLGASSIAEIIGSDANLVRSLWRSARARKKPSKSGRIDFALERAGRCRCGLLLPCTNCLPATAVEWRAYAGGPSE
jgi:hypothetical protein